MQPPILAKRTCEVGQMQISLKGAVNMPTCLGLVLADLSCHGGKDEGSCKKNTRGKNENSRFEIVTRPKGAMLELSNWPGPPKEKLVLMYGSISLEILAPSERSR